MQERRFVVAPVVKVLCVLTFVLAAKHQPEETPACSFEVDGFEQKCAKLETGCNTSEEYQEVLHDLEYFNFSRNQIDYLNITFNVSFNDGILLLYGTEDCWTFQLLENIATKTLSNVKLNFNFIPNNHMKHPGSIYYRGEGCQLMSVDLEGRLNSVSREFTLQFRRSERIKTVEITLMGAECYINCSGAANPCKVDRLDTVQLSDMNQQIIFSNLTYGHYYCIRVEESRDCPAVHTRTRQLKLVVNLEQPIEMTSATSVNGVVILFIVGSVAAISAKAIIALRRGRENGHRMLVAMDEEGQVHWISVLGEWKSAPRTPNVLLLYSRDSVEFCEVMEALRKLLEECGNMQVLDPFDQSQREEVSQNISGWVMRHMSTTDVKIIIVESEGSCIRQQALLNNRHVVLADNDCLDPVFTFALMHLHNDYHLKNDSSRLFRIRFESITGNQAVLNGIVPLNYYSMLQQLGTLIMELKSFSFANNLTLEDIRLYRPNELEHLEHCVSNMEAVLMNNPHHIQRRFMLKSS